MNETTRILMVEERSTDAELAERVLRRSGLEFSCRRVDSREEFVAALRDFRPHVILADYRLPSLTGLEVLSLTYELVLATPVLIVTSALNEETAADCIKAGASDYVLKERLTRLPSAVRAALEHRRAIEEKKRAQEELRAGERKYRALFTESRDGIFVADAATERLLDANAAMLAMSGYRMEQLRDMPLGDLVAPQSAAAARDAWRATARGMATGAMELDLVRADGSPLPVEVRAGSYAEAGGAVRFFGVVRDISGRRAAEAAAREHADRFRLVVENTPDAVLVHTDGVIAYANPAAVRVFGAESAEALVGQPVIARVDPAYRDQVRRRIASIASGQGAAEPLEEVLLRMDGSPFQAEVHAVPFPQGEKTSVLVYARDITDRVAAARALREGEVRYRQVVEGGPEALFTSADMRFTYVNPAGLRLFGASSGDELIGRPTLERISPASHALVRERVDRMLSSGLPTPTAEEVFVRLDGTPFDVEVSSVPFPHEGGQGVLTFFRDITQAKRATAELALLSAAISQAGEVAIISDTDGTIRYVNPAFERVTGYTAAEAIGRNPRILKSGVQPPETYAQMWAALTAGRAYSGTFVNRRKNGNHYVAEVVISPVRDAAGKVIRYVGLQRDVTREHDLEEQLRQSQKMEAVGQLTGGIAHDFNNLLGVILANASLLAAGLRGQEPELWSYLGDIEHAAEAGSEMVRKLLAFGRRGRLSTLALDLGEAVRDLEHTLRRFLPETIAVHVDLPSPGPAALVDPGALEQIMLNLATNARDAMRDGGTLTIALRRIEFREADAHVLRGTDRPGQYACLSVADTGTGMDEAVLGRAFEPFFTTKPPGAGSGLGLPMVFGLMKQHGGFLRVHSEPGHGTTVRLYFPAVGEASAPAEERTPRREPHGTETILVVEDQPMLRRATARALESLGYQILAAADGEEGLRVFSEHAERVRLVISDRVMPALGGVEMYERLRAEGHRVPYLLMSGYASDAGGIPPVPKELSVLEKPWTVEALAARVREMLDAPSRPPT